MLFKILCWNGQRFLATTESWYEQNDAWQAALKEQALNPKHEYWVIAEQRVREFVLR